MKRPARILTVVGALILLVLLLLVAVPLLFRNRIADRVKTQVNSTLDASVDWRDVGLSFFRDFPNLTLTLDSLTVVGKQRFAGDTLAAVRHLRVALDLASVLGNVMGGRPVVVRAVELDQPRLSLVALEDGTANWDITKKTPEAAKPEARPRSRWRSASAGSRSPTRPWRSTTARRSSRRRSAGTTSRSAGISAGTSWPSRRGPTPTR